MGVGAGTVRKADTGLAAVDSTGFKALFTTRVGD
jgi:hypothetical protein